MKKLSVHSVEALTKRIFVRFNFEGDFMLLIGFSGKTFINLDEAQAHLRKHCSGITWEVSTFEQALMNNGMRDNL